jgi:hypothetical protein
VQDSVTVGSDSAVGSTIASQDAESETSAQASASHHKSHAAFSIAHEDISSGKLVLFSVEVEHGGESVSF